MGRGGRKATYWTARKTGVGEGKLGGVSEPDTLSLSLWEGQGDVRKAGGCGTQGHDSNEKMQGLPGRGKAG